MHKKTTEAAEETLTDSMKMFKMGLENGKPKAGEKGVQPEWFYKGNGTPGGRPASSRSPRPPSRSTAARSRKWPASTSSAQGRRAVPRRLCRVQRILRSRHRADQLSLPRPFQAAPGKLRPGNPHRRAAGGHPRHVAHPSRRQGDLRKAVPVGRGEHVATPSPISNITISNTACSASRATCMSICSALRRFPSPTASSRKRATSSRSKSPEFGLPLRNPLADRRRRRRSPSGSSDYEAGCSRPAVLADKEAISP